MYRDKNSKHIFVLFCETSTLKFFLVITYIKYNKLIQKKKFDPQTFLTKEIQ